MRPERFGHFPRTSPDPQRKPSRNLSSMHTETQTECVQNVSDTFPERARNPGGNSISHFLDRARSPQPDAEAPSVARGSSNLLGRVSAHRAMSAQASLEDLWLGGKAGGLSAREQLKAWALREAWREHNDGGYGMHAWIAERLTKNGGGQPTNNSVREFLDKVDAGDDSFPGKQYGEKRGSQRSCARGWLRGAGCDRRAKSSLTKSRGWYAGGLLCRA